MQTVFYPVNSLAMITAKSDKTDEVGFGVYTRQAFGVSSRANGKDTAGADRGERVAQLLQSRVSLANPSVEMAALTHEPSLVSYGGAGANLEIMLHRHLTRDDGRGLAQVCACTCVTVCVCA